MSTAENYKVLQLKTITLEKTKNTREKRPRTQDKLKGKRKLHLHYNSSALDLYNSFSPFGKLAQDQENEDS